MSINYRLYQDNRKNSKKKGHWYARTVVTNCVDIKALAARISNSCTVTEPDILAVISALVTEMNYALTQGSKVKVDGLGTFRVGIHSHGVEKADDFNVQKDIFSPHEGRNEQACGNVTQQSEAAGGGEIRRGTEEREEEGG